MSVEARCYFCGSSDHTTMNHVAVKPPACPRCGSALLTEDAAFSGLRFQWCDRCDYVEEFDVAP